MQNQRKKNELHCQKNKSHMLYRGKYRVKKRDVPNMKKQEEKISPIIDKI